jgi:hypothetical protein
MSPQPKRLAPYRATGNLPTRCPQSVIRVGSGRIAIGICVDDASCVTQIPNRSTIRTRSAIDRAPILAMSRLLWTRAVCVQIPRCPAICLGPCPDESSAIVSLSRGESDVSRPQSTSKCRRCERAARSRSTPHLTASSSSSSLKGLVRKSTAPAFIARNRRPDVVVSGKKNQGCFASGLCQSELEIETAHAG